MILPAWARQGRVRESAMLWMNITKILPEYWYYLNLFITGEKIT